MTRIDAISTQIPFSSLWFKCNSINPEKRRTALSTFFFVCLLNFSKNSKASLGSK